jgi:ribosomal-protein-alanine N-acetyltransferase
MIVLTPMAARHLAAVTRIEAESSPQPWSFGLFAGELTVSAASRHWLVAERDGSVVGFGGMMMIGDEAHLMNIAVDRPARRLGIARRLLTTLIADVVESGCRHLTMEVRPDNVAALEMYRAFGLAPVGIRPDYYGPGSDAMILWVHDIDDPGYLARIGSGERA